MQTTPTFHARISVRLFGLLFAVMLLPTTALFMVGYSLFDTALRLRVQEEATRYLGNAGNRIEQFMRNFLELSGKVTTDETMASILTAPDSLLVDSRRVSNLFDSLTGFFPYNQDLIFCLLDERNRLFTNWSQNLHDYRFLPQLPIVQQARASQGFVAWESFGTPFVFEEKNSRDRYVSLARLYALPNQMELGPILILSFRQSLFQKILEQENPIPGAMILLMDATGKVFTSTFPGEVPPAEMAGLLAGHANYRTLVRLGWPISESGTMVISQAVSNAPGDLPDKRFYLVAAFPYDNLAQAGRGILLSLSLAFGILMVAALVVAFFASRFFITPISQLSRAMSAYSGQQSPLPASLLGRSDEIGQLATSFYQLQTNVAELFRELEKEHEIREHYRFFSLQSQLNPHFLFNSLNSIRFMAIINKVPNMIEAIDAISTVLQHSMGRNTEFTTLGEELDSLESLVYIHNTRFGARFHLEISCQETYRNLAILRFILNPVVENAILHGYRDAFGSGMIQISVQANGEHLHIAVSDQGRGIDSETLSQLFAERHKGGIGLYNIREMIRTVHGQEYDLTVQSHAGQGCMVNYILPRMEQVPHETDTGS